jgi:preprotein translocase subunit Sss1
VHDLRVGERLRRTAEWLTWSRFIKLFLGGNAILLSILLILALADPPDWLSAVLVVIVLVILVIGGVGMFAWGLRRAVIGWRDRY